MVKRWTLLFVALVFLFLTGCTQKCRYVQGPANLTVIGDMTGGSLMANLGESGDDKVGQFVSYPTDPDGRCPLPPEFTNAHLE